MYRPDANPEDFDQPHSCWFCQFCHWFLSFKDGCVTEVFGCRPEAFGKRLAAAISVTKQTVVRPITGDDINAIIDLDKKVTGEAKPDYWQWKLSRVVAGGSDLARVATIDGKIIGFLIGEIRSREFGQPPTGWITDLGVDPDYRRQGIGRRLLAEILDHFRTRGLQIVRTMVEWSDGEMLSFFTAMGFDRGPYIELEKRCYPQISQE